MKMLYQYFLKNYVHNGEQYSQAKLMIKFGLIEIIVCLIDGIFHPYFSFHIPRFLFFIPLFLLPASFWLLRTKLPLNVVAHFTVGNFWFIFCVGIIFSGGIFSLVTPWLALLPIMAYLVIDSRAAKIWFVAAMLTVIFFTFFFHNPTLLQDESGIKRSFAAYLGLVVVAFSFAHLFHLAETKLTVLVKGQNNSLIEQKEEILTQNEELTQQRNEITAQRDHIERQNKLLREQNLLVEKMNQELAKKAQEIFDRNATLEKHWHTLLEISKSRSINFGDFDEALKHIVKTAADSLKTDRVSVWQYEPDRRSIKCLVLYELREEKYTQQEELLAKDFPRYFEALQEEEVIPADNAETDSHTFEFKEAYLKPYHIESMMDTPYFLDGKLGGVLCCENLTHRHWLPEDIIFAQALSDIITLVFRATQRREYEAKIREHKKEISRANFDLEERIKERTAELESQNNQLAEYAFINSHLLRGPLCRLLGLINLIEHTEIQNKEKDLIGHLRLSGEELDEVVKKINSAIEKGGHFNRQEFGNFGRN
jgi:GAF domain